MANNNINWLGNRVLDANSTRQQPRSATNDQISRISTNDQTPTYQNPPMEMLPEDNTNIVTPQPRAQNDNIVTPLPRDNIMTHPPQDQFGPPPVFDINYVPGYLSSNIGKNVRAEFVFENSYIDKVGKLIEVGVNYFVLDDVNSRTHIMCDLYSVRFVTVIV